MSGMTKKIQKLFYTGEQFLDNAEADPEASDLLATRGIDAAVLAQGRTLYDAAKLAVAQCEAAFATQLQATDDFKKAFDASWAETQDLARILAEACRGQIEPLTLLGLHKRRDASTGESELAWPRAKALLSYMPWARNLYARLALVEMAATAARFGYTAEDLAAMAARVETVSELDDAQERAKAHARQATLDRDEAVAAFKAWLDQQVVVARVAFKGRKRLLQLLGLR
jgi:hypothetical protein